MIPMVAELPHSGDGRAAGAPADAGDDLLAEESEALAEASSEMRHMLVAAPQHAARLDKALADWRLNRPGSRLLIRMSAASTESANLRTESRSARSSSRTVAAGPICAAT